MGVCVCSRLDEGREPVDGQPPFERETTAECVLSGREGVEEPLSHIRLSFFLVKRLLQ